MLVFKVILSYNKKIKGLYVLLGLFSGKRE